jgi:hypothetical protein
MKSLPAMLVLALVAAAPVVLLAEAAALKCPQCGTAVPDGAKFCPKCGTVIPNPAAGPAKCQQCGEALPDGALFCPKCGAKVGVGAATPAALLGESPGATAGPTPPPVFAEEKTPDALADEIMKEAEVIRQAKFGNPFYRKVVAADEGRRLVEGELDSRYSGSRPEYINGVARLVGLIPAGCSVRQTYLDLLQDDVQAMYNDGGRTIHLVKRDTPNVPPLARRLLFVQEFANALDHQAGFMGMGRGSLEMRAGRHHEGTIMVMCLVEGSGLLLQKRYLDKVQKEGTVSRAAILQYTENEAARYRRFLDKPVYFHVFLGAHVCGMRFLLRGQPASAVADGKATGEEALRAVGKDLPLSTEQILHPEKFFDPEARDGPISVSDFTVERLFNLTGGWSVSFKDVLGEMQCALLARPKEPKPSPIALGDPGYYMNEAAAGWGGDRFYLITKRKEGRPFTLGPAGDDAYDYRGIWITVWDAPKDREEFIAAYEKNAPAPQEGRATERLGQSSAIFFYGFDQAERGQIMQRMRENPPTFTRAFIPL